MRNDVRDLLREAQAQGLVVEKAGNGHWKISNPETGRSMQIAATPSDRRSHLNSITRMKHTLGYVPVKRKKKCND